MDRHGSEEAGATGADIGERFVDRNKSMLGMHEACVGNAIRTVVPVGAVQALVADTADELVAAIADRVMMLVSARGKLGGNVVGNNAPFDGGNEAVLGMMAVGILGEAVVAQIVVLTGGAVQELRLGELLHAAVACSHNEHWARVVPDSWWNGKHRLRSWRRSLFLLDRLDSLSLWRNDLGCAADEDAVLLEPLD
jgi:hypothetical protein